MELIDELAQLPPEALTKLVEEARAVRARKMADAIPEMDLKRLKALHALVEAGDDVSLVVNLPMRVKLNIGTEGSNWEFGHVRKFKMELDETASEIARTFFKRYMSVTEDVIREDTSSLETLSPVVSPVLHKQTELFREFDHLRRKIEDNYEVDVWKLLEEKK